MGTGAVLDRAGSWANLSGVGQRNVLYLHVLVSACCVTNCTQIQLVTRTHSGFVASGSVGPRWLWGAGCRLGSGLLPHLLLLPEPVAPHTLLGAGHQSRREPAAEPGAGPGTLTSTGDPSAQACPAARPRGVGQGSSPTNTRRPGRGGEPGRGREEPGTPPRVPPSSQSLGGTLSGCVGPRTALRTHTADPAHPPGRTWQALLSTF